MAYVFRTFGCPECGGEFEVMQERDEGPPAKCQICAADMTEEGVVIPLSLPRGGKIVGSPTAKGVDMTYKMLEDSSAAMAAESGNPHLKVTDLKDNLRMGDVAAKPVQFRDPVYRHMIENGLPVGFQSMAGVAGAEGSQIAKGVPKDPETKVAGDIISGAAANRRIVSTFNREQAMKDAGRK